MDIESDLAPAASVSVEAILLEDELIVDPIAVITSSGRLDGSVTINLGSTISGALQYRLSDTAPLEHLASLREDGAEELPFEIMDLISSGAATFSIADGSVQAALQVAELSGEFGDYPFQGNGQVEYLDGSLQFDSVNLSTADNQLSVSGSLADELDFGWEINAPRLDQFMAGLTGRLITRGEVTGTLDDLSLDAAVDLSSTRFDAYAIDSLGLELSLLDGTLQGQLSVSGASLQSESRVDSIDSLTLQISGSETSHALSLRALSSYGNADLAATGGFTDLAALAWEGQLDQGTLETPIGEWRTTAATAISVTSEAIRVAENCWAQNDASICLDFSMLDRATNPVTQLRSRVNDYSLEIFNQPDSLPEESGLPPLAIPRLPEAVRVTGFVDAELALTLAQESNPAISIEVLPRAVSIDLRSTSTEESAASESAEPVTQTWLLMEPNLAASLADRRWEFTTASGLGRLNPGDGLATPAGSLDARGSLAENGNLEATVNASLGDLAWLGAFVPAATSLGGSLGAIIDLSGSLESPQLALDIQLAEGRLELAALGVDFTEINTQLKSDSNELIELSASAVSGTGDLALSGRIVTPFATTRHLEASLSGQQFTLANLPDLKLAISPELEATADSERINVSGNLTIPVLNLVLRELPEQAVDISRDAVVVAYPAEQPDLAATTASEQSSVFNIPVVADVNILLGEDVSLRAFGFTSTLAGNLNVQQRENGTNLTYGELEIVQGDYRMYGQSLQIRGGKLLFFGAMDNPALDMRATRTVGDTTVGVLMNGTLKNIRSQLFSTPALPDSDIIAILATGKPFSEIGQGEQDRDAMLGSIARLGLSRSQGLTNQVREQLGLDSLAITNTGSINNTTLTVGKYLTPDIFVRYGFGIFDHQSKLALDYFLTERFTLQAETGEYQSVDLIYRVER
jgi:translocation and assembly module TamB